MILPEPALERGRRPLEPIADTGRVVDVADLAGHRLERGQGSEVEAPAVGTRPTHRPGVVGLVGDPAVVG